MQKGCQLELGIQSMYSWYYLGGPSAGAFVWSNSRGLQNIIERWCSLTGDDEDEYTATKIDHEMAEVFRK